MIDTQAKKRKYYILVVLILATLAVLILPNLIISSIQEITKNTAQQLDSKNKDAYKIEDIESAEVKNGCPNIEVKNTEKIYTTMYPSIGIDIASDPNYLLYCIQYGTFFDPLSEYNQTHHGAAKATITLATAKKYGGENFNQTIVWKNEDGEIWFQGKAKEEDLPDNGKYSYPLLKCVGHWDLVRAGSHYAPDAAYILTYPNMEKVTDDKQQALWYSSISQGGKGDPNEISEEADYYKGFHDTVTDNGTNLSTPDIKAKDETQKDLIKVKADISSQTLIVGPYSIDYISGINKDPDLTFGGITDMYMVGYDAQEQEVNSRIEIKQYIDQNNGKYNLQYFKPNKQDKSYVDRSPDQVYPKGKSGGEDFFNVVIDNPNKGVSNPANYVAYVELHIEFQWMVVTEATACELEAKYFKVVWEQEKGALNCLHKCSKESGCITGSGGSGGDSGDDDEYSNCKHKCNGLCAKFGCHHKHTDKCKGSARAQAQAQASSGCTHEHTDDCYYFKRKSHLEALGTQNHINFQGKRTLFKAELIIKEKAKITAQLGGYVWEDVPSGKENLADGNFTSGDRALPNIKVTLYTENGQVADLMANPGEGGLSDAEVMSRVNPTYTNEAGYYLFDGIDPLTKYYVEFEYNGQTYLPTDYDTSSYNSSSWETSSKGTEDPGTRDSYDQTFEEIGSSPANYRIPGGSIRLISGAYNQSFSQYDLMGFEMTESGDYRQGTRLIDSFYKIENGNIVETDEIQEGEISREIRDFITSNQSSPSESDIASIYRGIAGGDQELLKKLQFIADTKIQSYTQAQGSSYDLYPIYDKYIINNKEENSLDMGGGITVYYDNATPVSVGGGTYKPIYPGQYYINQGLWRRPEVDIALRKDVLYAATRINGKTEVYEYNKRNELTTEQKAELRRLRQIYEQNGRKPADYKVYLEKKAEFEQANNKDYWEIQLRMRDYNNYYAGNYTRELYTADYNYRSNTSNKAGEDKELQLYVTYKITVRNASQSVLGEITEIVDYYDKDYTYRDDLSWVMYKGNSNSNNLEEINFTESDYYDTISKLSLQGNISSNNKGTKTASQSQYETRSKECKSDMAESYNDLYVKGLEGKKLASGEEAYIYLTFQVRKDGDKPVIVDEDNSLKQNYVEINGYKTYYRDGTSLPNGVSKGSNDAAGIIDINSTPGNLCKNDLRGNKYEKNFENDTDRAKSIKITVDNSFIRSINGNVWEDERTHTVSGAVIGDGIRKEGKDGEIGINGATVELVERLEDGSEYIWQKTTTKDGKYEFKTDEANKVYIIPGNYFIRFHYGDTTATANVSSNGGANTTSYNGQDFKSTVYQKNMNDKKEFDAAYTGMKIDGYDGKYNGNEVGYYDIKQADKLAQEGVQFSDAKDLWEAAKVKYVDGKEETLIGRQEVIKYSNSNVTNQKAEVLASPYTTGNTSELINQTKMTAVTGLIVLEGEYNRTSTDGSKTNSNGANDYQYGNDQNGKYTLNNVDLGLTERPKAELEISKRITNLKLTQANGEILFDANNAVTDLKWLSGTPYGLKTEDNGKYPEYYGVNNHRYAYREQVDKLVASKYKNSNGSNGLLEANVDDEILQGANIRISYELTVKNVGELDYAEKDFYYKGTGEATIVTTSADKVTDYVANNLTFKDENNGGTGWKKVENAMTTLELKDTLATSVAKHNTVVATENLAAALKPEEEVKVGLVLTQLISPQNSSDDRKYENITEITTISNTVGRRMAYSIQGNQDPTQTPKEVDSATAERVTIGPPTGIGEKVVYIGVAAAVLAILTTGIILIKKKVLNKE